MASRTALSALFSALRLPRCELPVSEDALPAHRDSLSTHLNPLEWEDGVKYDQCTDQIGVAGMCSAAAWAARSPTPGVTAFSTSASADSAAAIVESTSALLMFPM
jgi:hypothetical protein